MDSLLIEYAPRDSAESITSKRLETIEKLLDMAEHYRLMYQSPGIKCKVRPPTSYLRGGSSTQSLTCDAAILGSLIRHYSSLGIFPTPQRPYRGLSVGELAKGLKELRCFVDFDAGHGVCLVVGQVVRRTEEVLGSIRGLDVGEYRKGAGNHCDSSGGKAGGKGSSGHGFVWVHRGAVVPAAVNTDEVRAAPMTTEGVGSLFGGELCAIQASALIHLEGSFVVLGAPADEFQGRDSCLGRRGIDYQHRMI